MRPTGPSAPPQPIAPVAHSPHRRHSPRPVSTKSAQSPLVQSVPNSRRRTTRLAALARAQLHAACMRPVRRTWNPRNLGWARCAVGRYVQHPTHPFYDGLRATLTTPELGVTISAPDVLDQCRNPRPLAVTDRGWPRLRHATAPPWASRAGVGVPAPLGAGCPLQ